MALPTQTVEKKNFVLSPKQAQFIDSDATNLDFEGAVRSGKTWAAILKALRLLHRYPGIAGMLSRYTEDSLNAQLKPEFYKLCPADWLGRWIPEEDCQEIVNGSRLYLRALKSGDSSARYRKTRGLTLGFFIVDQAEELPFDIWEELKPRASQPGMPQQRILVANPPSEDHWLARAFPDPAGRRGDHELIRVGLRDNPYLDERTITQIEADYPPGHPLRRRNVDGERGIDNPGDPVYGHIFRSAVHVNPALSANPELPLMEAWDFGKAAVLWSQWTLRGGWNLLAEYYGGQQFIEEAVPAALHVREMLFPMNRVIRSCCDPAGSVRQGHGMRRTAVDVLRDEGVVARWIEGSNHPTKRFWAIQEIAKYLTRLTPDGVALQIHPRCRLTIDAFSAGYVWSDKAIGNRVQLNVRMPKKDGRFDHIMNAAEYTVLNFGPTAKKWQQQIPRPRQVDDWDLAVFNGGRKSQPSGYGYSGNRT